MRKVLSVSLALVAAFGILAAQDKGGKGGGGKGGGKGFQLPPTIQVKIAGVGADGMFPAGNAGQGSKSPAITWSVVPAGTQSFALLLHDPEPVLQKSATNDVTHWMVFNIPGTATGLPAGVPAGEQPDGTRQVNTYFGPAPPAGHGIHHYTLELWALDTKLDLPQAAPRPDVMKAMDGHVLGKGYVVAPFENK